MVTIFVFTTVGRFLPSESGLTAWLAKKKGSERASERGREGGWQAEEQRSKVADSSPGLASLLLLFFEGIEALKRAKEESYRRREQRRKGAILGNKTTKKSCGGTTNTRPTRQNSAEAIDPSFAPLFSPIPPGLPRPAVLPGVYEPRAKPQPPQPPRPSRHSSRRRRSPWRPRRPPPGRSS